MPLPKVIVIGGAPGVGKSTLSVALACRLNFASVSMDDLYAGAKALTTFQSHPALHAMRRVPSHVYFTDTLPEQLIADAQAQHEAMWPMVEAVIRSRLASAQPVVLEGWFVTPERLGRLALPDVLPLWITITPEALEARERSNFAFFARSASPEQMLQNFLARSLWHNERVREQACNLGQRVLTQDGTVSVEALSMSALQ